MADESKKKKVSETVGDQYNESADKQQQNANELADALLAENARAEADRAQALNQYQGATNAAQEQYRQNAEKFSDFLDVINTQAAQDVKTEEAEAAAENQANMDAAKWTGVTELVSSVANLAGVGAGNAVSQQYHQYSQDWMRKADADAKAHRSRIQSLRERQRSIGMQINQLKLGEAQRALEMANKMNELRYNQDIAAAERNSKANLSALQMRHDAASKAEELRLKGQVAAADVALKEDAHAIQREAHDLQRESHQIQREAHDLTRRGQDISAANHRADLEARYRLSGFTKDSKGNWVAPKTNPKEKKSEYLFEHNGVTVPYYMSSDERRGFLERAYGVLSNNPAFLEEYGSGGSEASHDNNVKAGIILKYAEKDPQLLDELYLFAPPEYRQSLKTTQAVDDFFNAGSPNGYAVSAANSFWG